MQLCGGWILPSNQPPKYGQTPPPALPPPTAPPTPLVTFRHPEQDVTAPETTLRSTSLVLDGILRDTASPEGGGNKILSCAGVSLEQVTAFVALATMSSYSPTDPTLTATRLAYTAEQFIPLVHMYDCKGLLNLLTEEVNHRPYGPSIVAILKYDSDSQWMRTTTLHCLAAFLFSNTVSNMRAGADEMTFKASYRDKIDVLPDSVVRDLLLYVLVEAKLAPVGGTVELTGPKGVLF